jgi:hypothetical protein
MIKKKEEKIKTSVNSRLLDEIEKIESSKQLKEFLKNIILEENLSDIRGSETLTKERYKKEVTKTLNKDKNDY